MHTNENSRPKRVIRVLIVDDQRSARQALYAVLSLLPQIQVVGEAASGQEAITQTSVYHPDVVLMDVQMPDIDGREVTRRIKQRWPDVRVVILTMYARHYQSALRAGADAFLLKGSSAEQLAKTIMSLTLSPDPLHSEVET